MTDSVLLALNAFACGITVPTILDGGPLGRLVAFSLFLINATFVGINLGAGA